MANERAAYGDDPYAPDLVPALGTAAYAEELRGMTDRAFCFSEAYGVQQGRADRTGAHPLILDFEKKLVKRAYKLGVPLFTHCLNRGADDQNRLYVLGHSKAKAGESAHNYGCAVDIVHGTKAWGLSTKQWQIIGHLGREIAAQSAIPVVWGGDDPGIRDRFDWDPAHWELKHWRDIRAKYREKGP